MRATRAWAGPRRLGATLVALVAVLATCVGCGSSRPTLTVFAAASLQQAFNDYAKDFKGAELKFQFAGSGQLAAQIQAGKRPDIFASANTGYPDQMANFGIASATTPFTANELVLATRADNTTINSLADVEKPGVRLVVGNGTVPAGSYFVAMLNNMPPQDAKKIVANVVSQESDVLEISGKLTQGAGDAGFLYLTDVLATHGKLRAIHIPLNLQPVVTYGIQVFDASKHKDLAEAFIGGLLTGSGQEALAKAGFVAP